MIGMVKQGPLKDHETNYLDIALGVMGVTNRPKRPSPSRSANLHRFKEAHPGP